MHISCICKSKGKQRTTKCDHVPVPLPSERKLPRPRLPWHLHGQRSDLELCKAHSAGIGEIFSLAKWATGHTKGQTDNNPCLLARKEFLSTFPWTWANGISFSQMLRQLTGLLSCNLTSNWKIPRPSRKQMANDINIVSRLFVKINCDLDHHHRQRMKNASAKKQPTKRPWT